MSSIQITLLSGMGKQGKEKRKDRAIYPQTAEEKGKMKFPCGGLRTSRPTYPWAFERELEGRARCPQRAGEKGKMKFPAAV